MKYFSVIPAVLILIVIAMVIFALIAWVGFAPGSGGDDENTNEMVMHFKELGRLEPCVDPPNDHTW